MAGAVMAGGAYIVSEIKEAFVLIRKMNHGQEERILILSNEHKEAMAELDSKRNTESNKHKEFMRLLEVWKDTVTILGEFILNAECEGCKGLPGNNNI